jgi:carbamoyltransferase
MIVLGIHDFHDSSACIMVHGELKALVAEERFSRLKRDMGYPYRSINFCLKQTGVDPRDIDHVAIASTQYSAFMSKVKAFSTFGVEDWFRLFEEYWWPRIYEKRETTEVILDLWNDPRFKALDHYYDFSVIDGSFQSIMDESLAKQIRLDAVRRHLGIESQRVGFYDHHSCHAWYALFGGPKREDNTLVYTIDGGGDKTSATLFRFAGGQMRELARSNKADPSKIYRNIAFTMGMKGGEHVHKVMGLAPYATDRELMRSWRVFDGMFTVKGDMICYADDREPPDNFFYFQKAFSKHRFDGIAGAVQQMFETAIYQWLEGCQRKYRSRSAVFAGGGAMNVKTNMILAESGLVDYFHVCPSPTDDTLCVGACYMAETRHDPRAWEYLKPITDVYLGPEFDRSAIEAAVISKGIPDRFNLEERADADKIASWLEDGRIVARLSGRMEFGERALGNRSILADPRNPETVHRVNRQIKYRDFWMPFAPVLLQERCFEYIKARNRDIVRSYMMIASETTDKGKAELPAAIHPADRTARPQVLQKRENASYYEIVKKFEVRTGIAGLVNTSFNLHGEPIVCSPEDALDVFLRSELDAVVMDDIAVKRF